jgi:hypothetical protein
MKKIIALLYVKLSVREKVLHCAFNGDDAS